MKDEQKPFPPLVIAVDAQGYTCLAPLLADNEALGYECIGQPQYIGGCNWVVFMRHKANIGKVRQEIWAST